MSATPPPPPAGNQSAGAATPPAPPEEFVMSERGGMSPTAAYGSGGSADDVASPVGSAASPAAGGAVAGAGSPSSSRAARNPSAGGVREDDRPRLRSEQGEAVGPRRVRLSLSKVDPWSVMKLSFLLSVGIGVMIVVASVLVWTVLDSMQVFGRMEDLLTELRVAEMLSLMDYVEFDNVLSIATLIAVLDIVLLTALSTLMAFLYNIVAALVGGLHVTLTDD